MAHKGTENLVPVTRRTKEEARKLSRKGGLASGKSRRRKADIVARLKDMLSGRIDDGSGNLEYVDALLAERLVRAALDGDSKALRTILEYTAGKAPVRVDLPEMTGAVTLELFSE